MSFTSSSTGMGCLALPSAIFLCETAACTRSGVLHSNAVCSRRASEEGDGCAATLRRRERFWKEGSRLWRDEQISVAGDCASGFRRAAMKEDSD